MIAFVVLAVVIVAACVAGVMMRAQSGRLKERPTDTAPANPELGKVGIGDGEPVILHFSAPWCGPCAAVRRVVAGVLEGDGDTTAPARDIELDFDENSALAMQLGVLSLPTTFLFDGDGHQRFRVSGVPTATDLRHALASL
ncbi:MAG TPA: thioredoxin family protein [Rhodococcus sp. (in: high G+C Gram-positive bacteria)]|nr:thioredoxin family protein [Rhodococcus sp. (in: high G+C Gram-positive bacteria)]